ncbi:hypothetical protein DL98DRAFT_393216, partial [Cadophora sp. DSE1049]
SFNNVDCHYRLVSILKLLPGLLLDTLTVLGSSDCAINHITLEGLVQHGSGWEELHYITPDSEMFGLRKNIDH